jgi:hypothetical protein
MTDKEPPDLVDVPLRPYVRAIGNLALTFAQAEATLLELTTEMFKDKLFPVLTDEQLREISEDETAKQDDREHVAAEKEAHELLKNTSQQTKDELQNLIRGSGIQGFDLEELIKTLPLYWADKDQRSRYMHDEWYTGIGDEAPVAFAGTRGITRKNPKVVWDRPDVIDVWSLALRFREYRSLFSYNTYKLRKRREDRGRP